MRHVTVAAGGKGLWFLPIRALDSGWRTVNAARETARLGPRAKVAALGSGFQGDPTHRPVIICTVNHHDEHDARRVLAALRALVINDALACKTDEATEHGGYGSLTSLCTSPAGTTKVSCPEFRSLSSCRTTAGRVPHRVSWCSTSWR
jgi:hypothetical protein